MKRRVASSIMSKRRKIIVVLLSALVLGLAWGQVRLPLAAVKSLADYDLLRERPVVSSTDEQLQMSAVQKWYLKRALRFVEIPDPRGDERIKSAFKTLHKLKGAE